MTTSSLRISSCIAGMLLLSRIGVGQPPSFVSIVPVVSLPAATATTSQKLGTVLGVRELSVGTLLVDDGGNRQLRFFDASLAHSRVVLDSGEGIPNAYGRRPIPIISYLGDTTLIPDFTSVALLVIDGRGNVVRAMAPPNAADFGLFRSGAHADQQGRLVFVGQAQSIKQIAAPQQHVLEDSLPLLRADLANRRMDTIAKIARPLKRIVAESPGGASILTMWTADLLQAADGWTVLSSGDVAIVRGHDYHLDQILNNGLRTSSAKIPFDWRQLTDSDKRRVSDSVRSQLSEEMLDGTVAERVVLAEILKNPNAHSLPPKLGDIPTPPRDANRSPFSQFTLLPVEASGVHSVDDYYPPVRSNGVMGDLDGNLWILPRTSTASLHGELVYDVVDGKGSLLKRVRMLPGRLLAGFGRNGVVFTTVRNIRDGFILERATLPASPKRM